MLTKVNKDVLVKQKDDILLRFSCNDDLGIYYEIINDNKIMKKKFVIRKNFKYFFITKDLDENINLICQDDVGNIVLYILIDDKWKHKHLAYIKNNYITPINTKGFFYNNELMLLLNLDSDTEKIYFSSDYRDLNIIYNDGKETDIEYSILERGIYASLIINSDFLDIHKIIVKSFNKDKGLWGNNQVVYISKDAYLDKSYYLVNNKIHFLILLNNEGKKQIIYKNIDIDKNIDKDNNGLLQKNKDFQEEIILFEHKDISSCLISEINNILVALWIIKNKVFASYSTNYGKDFSIPKVYKILDNVDIQKISFLEKDKATQTYFYEENGRANLILNEIFN